MAEQKNSNLHLRDIFAATPLGIKGREALLRLGEKMTPDEFIDKLYVEPLIYIKKNNPPEDDRSYGEDYDSETDPNPNELVKIGNDKKKFERLMHEKGEFEELFYGLDKSLYLITGSAGCGKTTYYYNLMRVLKEDKRNIEFYFCDLVESLSSFIFLSKREEFDRKNNVWIFIGYILNKILHPIFFSKTSDNHNEFIKNIVAIYKEYIDISGENAIADDIRQFGIFEELAKLADETDSREIFFNDFGEYIINKINELKNNDGTGEENEIEAVEFVMGLVLRMFFCLSKMEGMEKKYVCAIDSVEYYIHYKGEKRLQNVEIARIIAGIKKATDTMQKKIERIKEIDDDYKTFYAIVIMMRDTSEAIIEDNDQNEERSYKYSSSINISEWFDAKTITEKRAEYFKELTKNLQTELNVFKNVMNDISSSRWSMHDWLSRMYNHNKRGTIDCFAEAISRKSMGELNWFNTKWEEAVNANSKKLKSICRQYIFRIMLDYVQETKFFDHIQVATNGNVKPEYTSYARQIATMLHNSLRNNRKYLSFPQLIESVLDIEKDTNPTSEQMETLGKILYMMNEPNTDKSGEHIHWTALIEIKFDPKTSSFYNEEILIKALWDVWNTKQEKKQRNERYSVNEYGVRIRVSGHFFLDILPEFEYFSCIYGASYPPLFERSNLKKIDGKYTCLTIIRAVRNQAFKCIKEITKQEKYSEVDTPQSNRKSSHLKVKEPKRLYISNSSPLKHAQNILHRHIDYLKTYSDYIQNYTGDYCTSEGKKEISESISVVLNEYESELRNFTRYLNL